MSIAVDNASMNFATPTPYSGEVSLREQLDSAIQRAAAEVGVVKQPRFEELVSSVSEINHTLKAYGLQFDLAEAGNQVVTRVVDAASGELIRQIPNETVLHISERLGEVLGVLLKETA